MRKAIAVLLVVAFFGTWLATIVNDQAVSAEPSENTWSGKASMNEARYNLGSAVVNGRIYAIGGDNGTASRDQRGGYFFGAGNFSSANEEYDPASDTWVFKARMPTPRSLFATAVYRNKIYCIGGYCAGSTLRGGGYSSVNEVYDPATDTWETKASMPTSRYGMAISVVDGKFYVFGGTEEGVNTRIESYVNEVYDPDTDYWTTATEVPHDGTLGYLMTSAVVDREVYCIKSNTWIASPKQMIFYDPETDAWGAKATPPLNQSYPATAATTGVNAPAQIYVFDARANQVYDPRTGSWVTGAGMITPRDRVSIAVVEDALYVIGGIVGVPSDYSISVPAYPSSLNELYIPLEYSASPNQKSLAITWIATFVAVAAVIVGVVLLLYFKKRKQ